MIGICDLCKENITGDLRNRFCSRKCYWESMKGICPKSPPPHKPKVFLECKNCNKSFQRKRVKTIFCSKRCCMEKRHKDILEKRPCKMCGKVFECIPCNTKVFCSKKCLFKSKRGIYSPSWKDARKPCTQCNILLPYGNKTGRCETCLGYYKGGITPLNASIRSSALYTNWRNSVFKRDDWTCVKCKKRGTTLHAHHIIPFYLILEKYNIKTKNQAKECTLLWDISNGSTLCKQCHSETDTYKKRPVRKYPLVLD